MHQSAIYLVLVTTSLTPCTMERARNQDFNCSHVPSRFWQQLWLRAVYEYIWTCLLARTLCHMARSLRFCLPLSKKWGKIGGEVLMGRSHKLAFTKDISLTIFCAVSVRPRPPNTEVSENRCTGSDQRHSQFVTKVIFLQTTRTSQVKIHGHSFVSSFE